MPINQKSIKLTVIDKFKASKLMKFNGEKGADDYAIVLYPPMDINLDAIEDKRFEITKPPEIGNFQFTFNGWFKNGSNVIALLVGFDSEKRIHLNDTVLLEMQER